jgi:hypothetical protein
VVPLLTAGAVTRPLGVVAACLVGADVAEEGLMVGLFGRSFVFGFGVELSLLVWFGGAPCWGRGWNCRFWLLFAGLEFSVGFLEF